MKKTTSKKILAASLALTVAATAVPANVYADDAVSATWAEIYKTFGVDTAKTGKGYYDAVTSATNFTSRHAKDIPSIVTKTTDGTGAVTSLMGAGITLPVSAGTRIQTKLKSAEWTDSSQYGTDEFVIVPDDTVPGYVWNNYLSNLYAVTISDGTTTVGALPWIDYYGEQAESGYHYNKVQIALNSGTSAGANQAEVHRYDAFYENGALKPGTYTVTLYAKGFTELKAEIKVVTYEYMYASLDWKEYWAGEGVYGAGSDAASAENDSEGYADKGAFDAVSRATVKHGLQRASFQSVPVVYDADGKSYTVSGWSADGKTVTFADGSTASFEKVTSGGTPSVTTAQFKKADGTTFVMKDYKVTGIKYVPVRVASEDAAAFKAAYQTVSNDGVLSGGYTESKNNVTISAYTANAEVNKNTNGLKTAVKNADGTFSFSASRTGTGSGLKNAAQKKLDTGKINVEVKGAESTGKYGESFGVDLTGENISELAANLYHVTWKYYGDTNPAENRRAAAKAAYGTKFAADNWIKAGTISLGLTKSLRFELPEGTDGNGYWQITTRALGYADATYNFQIGNGTASSASPAPTAVPSAAPVASQTPAAVPSAVPAATQTPAAVPSTAPATSEAVPSAVPAASKKSAVIKVKNVSKTFKASKLKKKAQSFSLGASVNSKGTLSFSKVSGKKQLALNKKNGKITVKKNTGKGKYSIKVKISAKAKGDYKAAVQTVTVNVTVK